jgi:hypothetical protein
VAILSYRKYVQRAKSAEAYTMLGEIKAKQEAYKAEFSQYCKVRDSLDDANRLPTTAPNKGGRKVAWGPAAGDNWLQLGVRPDGPVWMGYVVTAGLPGASPTGPSTPAVDTNDHWWVGRALGDLDGDATFSTYESLSGTRNISIIKEGE